jgi:enamine deaminase RidA (YjgF/YER057c/UK114 family)
VTFEQANAHARKVGIQLLAALREATGSLDKVVRIGRVFGMVNAAPDLAGHPKVINGCSDLLVEIFGDRGRHARCAVGMGSLPFNMTVEIEALVEVVCALTIPGKRPGTEIERSLHGQPILRPCTAGRAGMEQVGMGSF